MPALSLDIRVRNRLARGLVEALALAAPGAQASLRGSLASGRADAYSDIDIRWILPDDSFAAAVARAGSILAAVQPVESLRSDPDFQNSARRRLVFAQFRDVPLFWRVDIEVFCCSIQDQPDYDRDNPAARGDDWSRTHSALMNATGAIKALLRGRPAAAEPGLVRAFQRIGMPPPAIVLPQSILDLVRAVVAIDPAQAGLAGRIEDLYGQACG